MQIKGFTLSELLIALALLGLIATFTIPKVLQSTDLNSNKARFREAYSALSEVLYQGFLQGEIDGNNFDTYYQERINATRWCASSPVANGCFSVSGAHGRGNQSPGFTLSNGVMLSSFNRGSQGDSHNVIIMDVNGAAGPNVEGEDLIHLDLVFLGTNGGRILPDTGYENQFNEFFE